MQKLAILVFLSVLMGSLSFGSWEHTYGGGVTDVAYAMQKTQDGGYVIAGMSNSWSGTWPDGYIVKTDNTGNLVWQQTYAGSSMGDYLYSIEQTADGGYICAGIYNVPLACDVYLLRVNPQGNEAWNRTFGGSGDDRGYAAIKTPDGGYIVIGYTTSFGAGGDDGYLIKTDSGGNMLWQQAIGGSLSDRAFAIKRTQDGGYIFCGASNSQSGTFARDAWLVKTDSSGNKIWEQFYGGSGDESANAIEITNDGGYILCGTTSSSGAGGYDVHLIKTNASGNLLWEKTFGGSGEDMGYSVCQTTDGGYFLVGHTASFGAGGFDVYVIKTDASGNLEWQDTYGGADWDYGRAGSQTSDLGYIIAGYTMSYGAGDYDFYLIKRDPGGIEDRTPPTYHLIKRPTIFPNPFVSFTRAQGCDNELFSVYNISGQCLGTYTGARIGEGLSPGVYFVKMNNSLTQP